MQLENAAQVEVPSNPQPHNATLPSQSDIPQAVSPSSSMIAVNPSSPPTAFEGNSLPAFRAVERSKYSSPPPPSSSMTPPPSTQPPKRRSPSATLDRASASTPEPSIFSSPPPTISYSVKKELNAGRAFAIPSSQQIAEASSVELRELLQSAITEIGRLDADVHEARMSAAHYKLQHNLLTIETEEAAKRMEVEHEMTRREVEVLQMAEAARRESSSPVQSQTSRYISELKSYCEAMDAENAMLHRRLQRAKKIIAEKEDDMNDLLDENRRYVERIKENREHLNKLKSPGGMYAATTLRNYPSTPQYRGTPKQTPRNHHQDHESQDSFATLLLADRVLNQENASAPSTPTTSRPSHRSHLRHNRGVQSLSSLPSTPIRQTPNSNLLPAVQFMPQSEPRYDSSQEFFSNSPTQSQRPAQRERRRKSRDSTISASDAEEMAAYHEHTRHHNRHSHNSQETEDEDIPESQASQKATAMLRRDPRESHEVIRTPTPGETIAIAQAAAEKSGLLQAKLFGNVTKPGMEKRKRTDEEIEEAERKRLRMAEAVGGERGVIGLGIGY
jgi:acetyl-CoA acyltransferase 1